MLGTPQGTSIALPINIVHEIDEDTNRHDSKINLFPQFLFNRQLCRGELPEMVPCLQANLFISAGRMILHVLSPRATFDFVVHNRQVRLVAIVVSEHALALVGKVKWEGANRGGRRMEGGKERLTSAARSRDT